MKWKQIAPKTWQARNEEKGHDYIITGTTSESYLDVFLSSVEKHDKEHALASKGPFSNFQMAKEEADIL